MDQVPTGVSTEASIGACTAARLGADSQGPGDKRKMCPVCGKPNSNMARHLRTHKEDGVAHLGSVGNANWNHLLLANVPSSEITKVCTG